jgi:hypothetical protein
MFTSRRVTRTLALAAAAAAMAATSAAAAPLQEPAQTRSGGLGADVDRSLAVERYYSSYGRPGPIARPQTEPGSDVEWPIVGLIGVGGLLIAAGTGTAIRKVRVRRHPARAVA